MRNLILLLLLAGLWGPSYMFIKIAVGEIPPVTLAAVRVVLAGSILLFALRLRSGPRTPGQSGIPGLWKSLTIMALAAHVFPFSVITWGQQYIDSAVAAMLNVGALGPPRGGAMVMLLGI